MAKLDTLAKETKGDNLNRAEFFGLVAKVEKLNTDEKTGKVNIDMEVVIDTPTLKAGDKVNVYFTDVGNKDVKSMETLKRNMGRGAGSVLMLENCNIDVDGKVQSQWLKQVAVSASKIGEGDDRMTKRKLLTGFMEQPVISFRNPSQQEGEPQQIRFGFTAVTEDQWVVQNGKGTNVPFSRDWAVGKLNDVLKFNKDGTKGVFIRTSMYEADNAVAAESLDALRKLVVGHLAASNNNEAVLRISDGDRVMVRVVRNKYLGASEGNQPADRTVDDVFSRSLFGYKKPDTGDFITINNADLDAALKDPDMKLEMIPGRQIPYNGDMMQSTKSVLVKKFAETPVADINEFSVPYGIGAPQDTLVGMVVTTEPFRTGEVYMAGTPMALARDQFTLEGLPTVNISGRALERVAGVQNEVFDGGQFEMVSEEAIKAEAVAQVTGAAPAAAEPAEPAAEAQAAAAEAPRARKF